MPRLTDPTYLQTCHELRDAWDSDSTAFFLLTATDQWVLHDFFCPSEALRDAELVGHRRQVTVADPSLPQRAGRALAKLRVKQERVREFAALPRPSRRGTKRSKDYEIRLFAEVQPELDPKTFARIIMQMAREQVEADRERANR